MLDLNRILKQAEAVGACAVHIREGSSPFIRFEHRLTALRKIAGKGRTPYRLKLKKFTAIFSLLSMVVCVIKRPAPLLPHIRGK